MASPSLSTSLWRFSQDEIKENETGSGLYPVISLWCPKGGLFPQCDKKIYLLDDMRRARAVLALSSAGC